ncbi:rubredoxin [Pseudoflavonifractor sp. MCC625]|uniref:rubredoxin n=1 Tax=Pseudoflavonifractor sp. MCC625 TaxID=2592647 RepID=UPI001C01DF9D|nr:rubredoxin [Pseudoflavonifractor sp. MCC625]MBT9683628.1 rubredoxin [Pseudoflavonifractor sp. MCC625]
MRPYLCSVCGYVYQAMAGDAARGVPPGTGFPDLPEEWACPRCHQGKELFAPMET